jgi:hypothetical protein
LAGHSRKELLAIHGVGPKAIAILGDALAAKGLGYKAVAPRTPPRMGAPSQAAVTGGGSSSGPSSGPSSGR